jgi:hypothetical protein
MTVDASRSCLGLGTCVGSAIRQIVDARVLLTATAPPDTERDARRVPRIWPVLGRCLFDEPSGIHFRSRLVRPPFLNACLFSHDRRSHGF